MGVPGVLIIGNKLDVKVCSGTVNLLDMGVGRKVYRVHRIFMKLWYKVSKPETLMKLIGFMGRFKEGLVSRSPPSPGSPLPLNEVNIP